MNIYEVTGTFKGFSIPSMKWTVSSQRNQEEFTELFESFVPEYNIEVYKLPLPEMFIMSFVEL